MIQEHERADGTRKGPEDFTRSPMKRAVRIAVEGIRMYSIGSLPVHEVTVRICIKRWKCTGPSRYRHITERSRFRFQVSGRDGTVLGWRTEAISGGVAAVNETHFCASDDDVEPGLLRRTEQLLAELVGVG